MLALGQSPPPDRLAALRDALGHRGPDGSGVEIIGNVGLVHTRLAIVDVSERAHQPMQHPNGRWWLSYNGEIFNHASIRRELEDDSFVSGGDTETLLHALATWGPAVLPRLNGQFAFAAVDLSARRLLLARDRFGIKPLYIACSEQGLWFASEPAALLAAGIAPIPEAEGWQAVLDWSCYSGTDTLLEGVHRLSPGTCMEVPLDAPQATTERWSSASRQVDRERQRQLQPSPRAAVASELKQTLRSAVHDALLGDVPMGTLCSGGVDSSLITAMAVEVKPDLVAFAARYRGDRALDEGPAAQRVADSLSIELDLFEVTKSGWREGFVPSTVHFGAPLATASSVTVAQLAERARRRGIKVLLTGEGADELFAGYVGPYAGSLGAFLSPSQRAVRKLEQVALSHPIGTLRGVRRRVSRLAAGGVSDEPTWPSRMSADSSAAADDDVGADEIDEAYGLHAGSRRLLETSLLRDIDFTLSHLLNRMDTNMMQVSVEARVPFLDPRVVDLALNMPLEFRVTPWSKGILRDVARDYLPVRIAHRPKIFGMMFDAGAWIEEAAKPSFLTEGVFRETFAIPRGEFDKVLARAEGALRVRLWSAEVWCRSVFAGDSVATIERALWPNGH